MNLKIIPPASVNATIALPTSKSITNRALVISALCGGMPQVVRAAWCDDTAAMVKALETTGDDVVNVGAAGTAMRFLTAYFATRAGRTVTLTGDERMCHRPIAPLVNALRTMGAKIDYLGESGYPPLRVTGTNLHGGEVVMDGSVSSQFISAVMMVMPVAGGGVIGIEGDVVSTPYIHMTARVMQTMGATVAIDGNRVTIGNGYAGGDCVVEADWSAAAPWYTLTALLPQSRVTLRGLTTDSIQGDARLADIAAQLGIASRVTSNGVELDASRFIGCCCSGFIDMDSTPDLALSWAVLLCLLERSFRMTGLRTLRHKESDRLEALREELTRIGYVLKIESDDAVSWHGDRVAVAPSPPVIHTHGDHRIAMAFAPAAVRFPGLVIKDAQVVDKSYPLFWKHLEQSGFQVVEHME